MAGFFEEREKNIGIMCNALEEEFASRKELTIEDLRRQTVFFKEDVQLSLEKAALRGIERRKV